jgi:hypothetical protein
MATSPQLRGVHIRPLYCPASYRPEQIDLAVQIMAWLNRGLFIWTEPPPR